ncbi:hypothetical protein EVAR_97756_1 [Eumeta japonica]|uniref:Uncharacterized protein n=1 Tax=Eumeta variegata TaxID=151549 RepID=A0A4C1XA57_EUMVA|nr:hypothetical protein EVAR_97756_1 [Eumeta japonica]
MSSPSPFLDVYPAAPKYVKDQEARAKRGCHKVYEETLKKNLIIDDEIHVPVDPSHVPEKQYFHATSRDVVDSKIRTKSKILSKYTFFGKLLLKTERDGSEQATPRGFRSSDGFAEKNRFRDANRRLRPVTICNYFFDPQLGRLDTSDQISAVLAHKRLTLIPNSVMSHANRIWS